MVIFFNPKHLENSKHGFLLAFSVWILPQKMYLRLLAAAVSAAVVQSFLPAFSSDTHQNVDFGFNM